jgi:hypothetical protein
MVSSRRGRLTAIAAVSVGVVAGFGGTPDAAPGKKAPRVCKLITTQEAGTILGTAANKGKGEKVTPRPGARASGCEWASKDKGVGGVEGAPLTLDVELQTGSTMESDFERAKARVSFGELRTVSGVGKDAFYDDSPFTGVHVLVGNDRVLSTNLTNYDTSKAQLPKQPEEMSIDAARTAVGRLTKK